MNHALDRLTNLAASHPRYTCVFVCGLAFPLCWIAENAL